MDMSLMAKFRVTGPDACRVLNHLSAADVDTEVGKVVYTPWCNAGGGMEADLTVTRLGEDEYNVITSDVIQTRDPVDDPPGDPAPRGRRRRRRAHARDVAVHRPGPELARAACSGSRPTTSPTRRSRTCRPARSRWATPRPWPCGSPTSASWAGSSTSPPTWPPASTSACSRPATTWACVPPASRRSARCGWRRATGTTATTSTTSTRPLEAGLGFTVGWDKAGFVGQDALLAQKAEGVLRKRHLCFLLDDPEPLLMGGEAVYRDGTWVGLPAGRRLRPHAGCLGRPRLDQPARTGHQGLDRRPAPGRSTSPVTASAPGPAGPALRPETRTHPRLIGR